MSKPKSKVTTSVVSTTTTEVELSAEGVKAVQALKEAKAAIKALTEAKKEAEAVIYAELGEAQYGINVEGEAIIKVEYRQRVTANAEKLRDEYPEVWDSVKNVGDYTQLKTL